MRGVCGAEQNTRIAYVPVSMSGLPWVLRVQVVPGHVPCLLPAYLLMATGAVIDLKGLFIYYTRSGTVQELHRRPTGHISVNITEFSKDFYIPDTYRFETSEVWCSRFGGASSQELTLQHANQVLAMPASLAPLLAAIVAGLRFAGHRSPSGGDPTATSSRSSHPGYGARQRALELQQTESQPPV